MQRCGFLAFLVSGGVQYMHIPCIDGEHDGGLLTPRDDPCPFPATVRAGQDHIVGPPTATDWG